MILFKKIILFALLILGIAVSEAQNNWDGDNPVGNFSYCNNWYSNACPGSWTPAIDLQFNYNNGAQTSIYYDLGTSQLVKDIRYMATYPSGIPFDTNGQGIAFMGKFENLSSFTQTINISTIGISASVIEVNPVNGNLFFNVPVYNTNNVNFNVYGNNGKKLTFNTYAYPAGNASAKLYIKQYSIVEANYNNAASVGGGYVVEAGELWVNAGAVLQGPVQVGNGTVNFNKIYISNATTATTVANAITVPTNSPNTSIGALNTSNTHAYTGTINLNNNDVYFDEFNAGGTLNFTGVISGTGGIRKINAGLIRLSAANAYTGSTAVNAGTVQLGIANAIGSSSNVILNGGTLSTGTTTGYTDTVGTLALTDNSTIALGTGLHTLTFAASNAVAWTAAKTLTITGWGSNCASGRIFVGSTSSGLTATQLAQITFSGFPAGAKITAIGELIPNNITLTATGGTLTGSYATLKAAFDAINLGTHTGVIVISVLNDTTETATAILNNNAAATSVLIQPAGCGARTISGAMAAGAALVDFNGADNVTVNGLNTSGNSLTISNTTASATSGTCTIQFRTDATNNTITNCTILGSSSSTTGTSGGNIWFGSGAVTTGNDNNTVSNCNIGPAGLNLPSKGIMFTGTVGKENDNITITGNNFSDVFSGSVNSAAVDISAGSIAVAVTNNHIFQTTVKTQLAAITHYGIRISNGTGSGYLVSGNTIGYAAAAGTGTYTINGAVTGSFVFNPIFLNVSTTAASSVQGNTIAGISNNTTPTSGGTPFQGINVNAGYVNVGDVTGNTIGLPAAPISIGVTTAITETVYGIYMQSAAAATLNVQNNTIQAITQTGAFNAVLNFSGIALFSTAAYDLRNNTIGNPAAGGGISIGTLGTSIGICAARGIYSLGTGSTKVGASGASNTVQAITVNAAAANILKGIELGAVSLGTVDISYNVIKNLSYATTTASTSQFWGINCSAAASGLTVSNNTLGDTATGLVTYSAAGGTFWGIVTNGGTSTGNVTLSFNDITGVNYPVASGSQQHYINNNISSPNVTMNDNKFTNLVSNTTGTTIFLVNTTNCPAGGSKTVSNNRIVGTFSKPSASGNTNIYYDVGSSAAGVTANNLNNDFSNITLSGTNGITSGWYNQDSGLTSKNISGNTFNNWMLGSGGVGVINSGSFGTGSTISNNIISNITTTGNITGMATGTLGNTPSLTVSNNAISALSGNAVYGISNSQPSQTLTCSLLNNTITGLSATNGLYGIFDSGASSTKSISGNTVSNLTNTSAGSLTYGIYCTAGGSEAVTNNTLATFSSAANSGLYGIQAGSAATAGTTITGNVVTGLTHTNTGTGSYIRAIEAAGTVSANVSNNTVSNINGAGTNSALYSIMGVYIGSSNAASTISNNTVSNVNVTNNSSSVIGLAAIITGDLNSGGTMSNNRVYGLSNASTSTSSVTVGYMTWGGTWTVANNMISVINNNLARAYGVMEVNNTGSRSYFYNSIYIKGTSTGNGNSAAITSSGNITLRNNILMNERTSSGKDYALIYSGALSALSSNYNILNSLNSSTVALYGSTDTSFSQWQSTTSGDANSYSGTSISFTNVNTADLHIAVPCSEAESTGTPVSVTIDYDSTVRNASTPDIGADEFAGTQPAPVTPVANPSICFGGSTILSVSSPDPTYTYSWSPATGLSATTGASVTANPTVTTIYTVTATSPAGCVRTKQITVTVNPLPTTITVTPPTATACLNTIQSFTASPVSSSNLTVGIATGTAVAANTPYRNQITSSESRVQYLITKAELNALGLNVAAKITSLGFNVTTAGGNAMPNYSISLALTGATSLTSTYISPGFSTVFTATNLNPVLGLNMHTFSAPFQWDGASNIVVNICHNGAGGAITDYVSVSTFATPRTTSGIAAGQCSLTTGATNLDRPVITLAIENPITWLPVTDLYTDAAATVPYVSGTHYPVVYAKPTAPIVYTATATVLATGCTRTATGTFATGTSTWNGSGWLPSPPTGNTSLTFAGNYNSSGNLSGCSCNVTSGNVVFNDPDTLTLTNGLTVGAGPGATMTFNNNASLVQINDAAVNSGLITMERITQPMYRFDYTYWGSPLTLASNYKLGDLSLLTLSDKYFSWTPTVASSFGTWFYESTATVMIPAKGYIVRAPQTFSFTNATLTPYTANFIGTPNNGVVTIPIYHGTDPAPNYNDDYNLLSNPYPSAVDAEKFLSDAANVPVLDGTIYFWTHNSPISTLNPDPFYGDFIYNYNANDYASWNKLGGTGTTSAAATGGAVPNGFIAAGQGFFTRSTAAVASGTLATFNNSMRAAGNNNQFFRTTLNSVTDSSSDFEKHRIWLNLISAGGTFNQILVGYAEGATLGFDRGYDGTSFSEGNSVEFYSVIPDNKFVIQGRPLPFTDTDVVPLGFKTAAQDTFSFRIDHFDSLFENQNVYVEDRLLGIIHDLKQSPYMFTASAGTFDTRFLLRFNDSALQSTAFTSSPNVGAFIHDHRLQVESSIEMESIVVFDLSGKQVKTFYPDKNRKYYSHDLSLANGVYLLKINLTDGSVVTKKLVN